MELTRPNGYFAVIWVWMALSSIVLFEPAPCDIIFILCLIIACVFSHLCYYRYIFLPQLLLGLFVNTNLIPLIFETRDIGRAIKFVLITFYLIGSWFLLTGLLHRYGQAAMDVIFSGYMVAALIATAMGIAAYFGLVPNAERFLYFGRAMGFFKDANVYGPFIVPMALYALYKFERQQGSRQLIWIFILAVLSVGILLSFSRAAWANYLISISLYFILPPWPSIRTRLWKIMVATTLLVFVLIFAFCQPQVRGLLSQRLGFKDYDNERFGTQLASLRLATEHPWGVGPGQTERIFNYSTHSLYVRVLTENGILGVSALLYFLLLTVIRSLQHNFRKRGALPYAAIISASLTGVLFNSFFIDTLHWRHFWLLAALPWIPLESRCEFEDCTYHNKVG